MATLSRRAWLAAAGLAPLAGALITPFTPVREASASPREKIQARHFPNVTLTTHEGQKVRFYDDLIKGKIVTLNFIYTACNEVCPGVTATLAAVQKLLGERVGRDIFMYSVTLTPEQDTPEVLKKYAEMYHAKPGWAFLTGQPVDIELLRRKLGIVDSDPIVDADKRNHTGMICYGNEPLMRWASCPGLSKSAWLAESIRAVDGSRDRRSFSSAA